MLSRLGGAAITSSGPARSLDRRSGNSRQDETHPDTLTAPTVTVGANFLSRLFSLPQSFCFFDLLLNLSSEALKKKCLVFWEIPKPDVLLVSAYILCGCFLSSALPL